MQLVEKEQLFGRNSKEVKAHWKAVKIRDSINRIRGTKFLEKRAWLASDVIGKEGISALFQVILHSDQKSQEKYLPMMKEAVKKGTIQGTDIAILEDRVALGQEKKQIYGSQIGWDTEIKYYIKPLEDPENVDKRRKEVGLLPLSYYDYILKIKWDPAVYILYLPTIEAIEKQSK
jgi:hypothetical protein